MFSASIRNRVIAMKSFPVILILVLAIALSLPVAAAPLNDTAKVVIVSFHYKDGSVTPGSSRVVYGYPPDNIANRDMLVDLVGKNGAVLGSYGIEDPRVLYSDKGAVLESDVTFSVILPFDANAQRVDLYDGATKTKLASADITIAYAKFCDAHRDDPDCGGGGSPLLLYGAVILLVLVAAGAAVWFFLARKKT